MTDDANFRPRTVDEPEPEPVDELDEPLDASVAGDPAPEPEPVDELDAETIERRIGGAPRELDDRDHEYQALMTAQQIVDRVFGSGFRYVRGWAPKTAGADPVDKRYGVTLYGHSGWDVAVKSGTPIYALAGGVVGYANDERVDPAGARRAAVNYGGKSVVVNLGTVGGQPTDQAYMHLSSIAVQPGQHVEPGELLGYSGSTGISTGPHLLFGIRQGGKYVDPTGFLAGLASSAWSPPKASKLPAFPTLPPVGQAFRGGGGAPAAPKPSGVSINSTDAVILAGIGLVAVALVVVATAGKGGSA